MVTEIWKIILRNAHHFHEPGNLIGTGNYFTFNTEKGGSVLAIRVKPPKSLINLKKEIEQTLNCSNDFKCQVYKKNIWHTTIWHMRNIPVYSLKTPISSVLINL